MFKNICISTASPLKCGALKLVINSQCLISVFIRDFYYLKYITEL